MSLVLQDTAGDDKNVVWVLKIHSEGVNLISNGTFTGSSNWTTSGDWNLPGTDAEYDFSLSNTASGDLDQTISAVSAAHYILEYEIKSVTGSGFTLAIGGTGNGIIAATTNIPVTVGFHRVDLFGVDGKTLFRLHAAAFGANDVLTIDNVKLRKADETAYLSTVGLSLNNTYDGKVLQFDDRLSDIQEFMDVQSSGSVGGVSSFTITIARYGANTKFDGFFNEFFPDEDGGILTARDIEVGMVWDNATTDTEITWLIRGRVVDYRYVPRKMTITVLQSTEIDSRPLPFYTVQKEFDNEVSYFINAPDDNYGLTLPIVYGAFNIYIDTRALFRPMFSPLVLVEKHKLEYIAATHKLETDNMSSGGASSTFKYLDGIRTFMTLVCDNGSSTNNNIRAFVTTFDTLNSTDNVIIGTINIRPTLPGSRSDISNYDNLSNDDNTDEITLTSLQECSLMIDGNEGDLGIISRVNNSVVIFCVQSDSVTADASNDTDIRYFNPEFNSGTGGYGAFDQVGWNTGDGNKLHSIDISTNFQSRDVSDEPWRWDELFNLEYVVSPMVTYTNKYKELWLSIDKIIVADARKIIRAKQTSGIITREEEGRLPFTDYITTLVNKTVFSDNFKPIDNAFGKLEGREYGRWIDHINIADITKNRTMGDVEGDLIDNPAYIIESIFRDEVFVERDLQVTSTADSTHFVCDDVISREDDFYNFSEYFNATQKTKRNVTDYVGSTNIFTVTTGTIASDNNIYLTNIQGDNKIDFATFDIVGNTTNGTRKDFIFARSLATKLSLETIINQLCFESHCQLFESIDPNDAIPSIKLVAIDAATSGDAWTSPAKDLSTGLPMVSTSLTPLQNVFTSYRLFYWWNYGKQDYEKELFVDENGITSGATILKDYEQLLCKKAKSTYRVEHPFSYSANWIYNTATAERMLQKKIRYFTKQRLIVNWSTGISDGTFDYIASERGDQKKLNFSEMIPAGLNNSAFFMITSKRIITVQGAPIIQFQLLEM